MGGRVITLDIDLDQTVESVRQQLRTKMGVNNARTICSVSCRHYCCGSRDLMRMLDSPGEHTMAQAGASPHMREMTFTLVPRMAPCRDGCQRLITASELGEQFFEVGQRLGFGSSGEVHAVQHTVTRTQLAMKTVRCTKESEQDDILDKYAKLCQIRSDGLVPFLGAFKRGQDVAVLMPTYRGTLFDRLTDGDPVTLKELYSATVNILEGLVVLASQNPPIVHRDVKASNVFLAPTHAQGIDYYLLGDMETSRFTTSSTQSVTGGTGTFASLAPEQILEFRSSPKTDLWGLGCLLHWMCVGGAQPKIMHTASMQDGDQFGTNILAQLKGSRLCPPNELCALITSMLNVKDQSRPTAEAALACIHTIAKANEESSIHICRCSLPRRGDFLSSRTTTMW